MPAGSRRTRSASSSKRSATSAIGVEDSTRMPRSSVSCASSAPTSRRSEVAVPPTATALWAGGGSSPSKVPATCRRTFSSSSTEGGSERR